MAEIDTFATQLLEEAKGFLEKARLTSATEKKEAYLHAALNLGFCSLEAHVNAIAEDFLTISDLSLHERSILSGKRIELENGEFRVTDKLQMYRLEDRLLFLCNRFSKKRALDRKSTYWTQLKEALDLRNGLTHPKAPANISEASVERALLAVLQVLDATYRSVYKKAYPAKKRGLQPTIEL